MILKESPESGTVGFIVAGFDLLETSSAASLALAQAVVAE